MHCRTAAAVLAAIMMPALASAAGQHPTDAARPHPAADAHANATAGQAGAARIEACTATANALIDHLARGDDKAATAGFDATMRSNLGQDKLAAAWKQVQSQAGNLERRGAPQNMTHQGFVIVLLPLHFTKAVFNAQVACNADGKIAGFFLRPATSSPLTMNP
ncbi:MAG: DUF3887 domain-containing protein [Rhodanobacteraceae bacterium]